MPTSPAVRLGIWLTLVVGLLILALSRLQLSYDLGLFLPQPQSVGQRVLVERLGDAPGTRFIMLAVPDETTKLDALLEQLNALPQVERVLSDVAPIDLTLPEPLWRYRYLLSDQNWSTEALADALSARLADLGIGSDTDFETLIAADPHLSALTVIESLQPTTNAPWLLDDGRRVLIVVTRAAAFDIDAQTAIVTAVRTRVTELWPDPSQSVLSGAGVFSVELRDSIQAETIWRSTFASIAIALVLLLVYRRLAVLILAALPLAAGVVAGIASVALVFGTLHGITLAFGFTLLGVAIDYPMHVLSRARHYPTADAVSATWPTLRLSALSTALAYGALMFGGATGMTQLGLFSVAGIAAALLTTRFVLPGLIQRSAPTSARAPLAAPQVSFVPVVVLALGAIALIALTTNASWWNANLAALSPIPQAKLQQEGALRAATGAPNIRYLVHVEAATQDAVLARAQTTHAALLTAQSESQIQGFNDLTPLLPPVATQQRRQAAIPTRAQLTQRLESAIGELPFDVNAFAPFLATAESSRMLPPLTRDDYAESPLAAIVAQHLYRNRADGWSAIATLRGDPDIDRLTELLPAGATLIDLRAASEALVTDYRQRTLAVLAIVCVVIAALLCARVPLMRALWALTLVLAAAIFVAALVRITTGALNLYHLTGLLLVFGIGLDYALFLSKPDGDTAEHAVLACSASTISAFGILGASSIPALGALGIVVALGSAVCFAAAWSGTRTQQLRKITE